MGSCRCVGGMSPARTPARRAGVMGSCPDRAGQIRRTAVYSPAVVHGESPGHLCGRRAHHGVLSLGERTQRACARERVSWGSVPAAVRESVPSTCAGARPGVLSAMLGAMTKPDRSRCGARCRSKGGAPCSAPVARVGDVLRKRCRLHGGLSTGPRTAEGRARSRAALFARWARWREEHAENPVVAG